MRNYIIFNDFNTEKFALIEELPIVNKAERDIEFIEIDGRHGFLTLDKKRFLPIDYEVDLIFKDKQNTDIIKQVFNGSGQLILSNEPNRYYKAVVQNVITFERQTRNVYICRISFKLQPFAYELNQKTITITEPPFVLTNHTNTTAQPIIKIYGTGTAEIYVNEHTVPIEKIRNCIILDYELKEAYNESEKRGTRNSDVLTDYPELLVGDNTISWDTSANITQIKIIPNWRWL